MTQQNNERFKRLKSVRYLGVTQIVVGSLCLILGIVNVSALSTFYWGANSGGGIWIGLWIIVTGILGVVSNGPNTCALGTHLAFCIITQVLVWLGVLIFGSALSYYNNCGLSYYGSYLNNWSCGVDPRLPRGVFATLLVLMLLEFVLALIASIFACQTHPNCCRQNTDVIITQQPAAVMGDGTTSTIITSTTGQTVFYQAGQQTYPAANQPHPPAVGGYPTQQQAAPPYQQQPYHPQQPGYPLYPLQQQPALKARVIYPQPAPATQQQPYNNTPIPATNPAQPYPPAGAQQAPYDPPPSYSTG